MYHNTRSLTGSKHPEESLQALFCLSHVKVFCVDCRAPPFFSDMYDYDDDDDEDEDDYYPRQYSRMEQQRAEQQWQRDRRAERLARRYEKV